MRDHRDLDDQLRRIDGSGYKAYGALRGDWRLPTMQLQVIYVQGDPFAAPSRVAAVLEPEQAGLPESLLSSEPRRLGVAAFLARAFATRADDASANRGSGRSGEVRMEHPGQVVGRQTAVRVFDDGRIEARFRVGLPARGRRVLGREARALLLETVSRLVDETLKASAHPETALREAAEVNEDQAALREALGELGLVAFVADDSHLPRRSGRDDRPLEGDEVVAFRSPDALRVTLDTPNGGPVTGMGIGTGVTLIVGGGYHGKSTLLRAIEGGVRNHRPGDGRERVVTRIDAVKVRAEDGRAVAGVDISPFIGDLPGGRRTGAFSTPNASGSTSQAAAIMEALEVGAGVLLVDEDTAATNFMIRDRRMQELVPAEREPITPFIDRIRPLHDEVGVSSILVLGGSGDYLDVADRVIAMNAFLPEEVTERARAVADRHPTGRAAAPGGFPWSRAERVPARGSVSARKGRKARRIRVHRGGVLELGVERIELGAVEQLSSEAEMRAIGLALAWMGEGIVDGERSIPEVVASILERVERDGLDALDSRRLGDLAEFRPFELAAALNRLRTLTLR